MPSKSNSFLRVVLYHLYGGLVVNIWKMQLPIRNVNNITESDSEVPTNFYISRGHFYIVM